MNTSPIEDTLHDVSAHVAAAITALTRTADLLDDRFASAIVHTNVTRCLQIRLEINGAIGILCGGRAEARRVAGGGTVADVDVVEIPREGRTARAADRLAAVEAASIDPGSIDPCAMERSLVAMAMGRLDRAMKGLVDAGAEIDPTLARVIVQKNIHRCARAQVDLDAVLRMVDAD